MKFHLPRFLSNLMFLFNAIISLLSALSCDLRGDFYPYFPEFFHIVNDIITKDQQDADVLNHAFNCLSHLVYFLHRYLSKDVDNFLK